jgi:hypothetical protein
MMLQMIQYSNKLNTILMLFGKSFNVIRVIMVRGHNDYNVNE